MASMQLDPESHSAERVKLWDEVATRWGFSDFLSPEDGFQTCLKTSRRWRNRDVPGIYFWLAEDGEAYVGQSIKPQWRLREHWRSHRDLVRACFMPCDPSELDSVEARLIGEAGRHFPLRNIKLSVSTSREVPFDKVIGEPERHLFLGGSNLPDSAWRPFDLLTRLQQKRFERFLSRSGSFRALRAVQTFVRRAIPKPTVTEVGFWSATIFPDKCFIRVNAGQQEVFTIDARPPGGNVRILSDTRLSRLRSQKMRYSVESYVDLLPDEELERWLTGERLLACRRLAVRLMRHTSAMNSGSHCPQAVRYYAAECD